MAVVKFGLIAAAYFCTAAFCGWTASMEIRPLLRPSPRDAGFSPVFASNTLHYGLSSYSKRKLLTDCYHILSTSRVDTDIRVNLEILAKSCQLLSGNIVQTMSTNSYAWFVNALASSRLRDVTAFRESYHQSHLTGPNEQWLADLRVRLGEENLSDLDAQARLDHEQDLVLLANSDLGSISLAGRYVNDPGFRQRAMDALSKVPPERQRRFLNNTKDFLRLR